MKGDFSRETFDAGKHYTAVLMQQGRVQTDADWNEQGAIQKRRLEVETRDVVGPCGAPADNAGFAITVANNKITISAGRMYVDGLLVENDTAGLDFAKQPDLADDGQWTAGLGKATLAAVYLDVWERHITRLDDPLLHEVALGEADTATRVKNVWQVRLRSLTAIGTGVPSCDDKFKEWATLTADPAGTMNARTQAAPPVDGPCVVAPTAGYRRLENQLYRVEVHTPSDSGPATFKFSRENASIATRVEKISAATVTVTDLGRDEALGLADGQWVELTDDAHELGGNAGVLVQVTDVDPATRVVTLSAAPSGIDVNKNPKLRRWDQVTTTTNGDILMTAENWQPLEDGIEVRFSKGSYRSGDYWLIPARQATGDIEWPPFDIPNTVPVPQPRRGIFHHYCKLALIVLEPRTREWKLLSDCRKVFPALTELPLAIPPLEAVHVVGFSTGTKLEIDNDSNVSLKDFAGGLVIHLDREIERTTVLGRPTVFVTLDIPYPLPTASSEPTGVITHPTIGVQPAIGVLPAIGMLPRDAIAGLGTIPLKPSGTADLIDPKTILWRPGPIALRWLEVLLAQLAKLKQAALLGHLTLRGNFIYELSKVDQRKVYVDGDVFGTGRDHRLGADLPTGDGVRGGDVEIWFWLGAREHPIQSPRRRTAAARVASGRARGARSRTAATTKRRAPARRSR